VLSLCRFVVTIEGNIVGMAARIAVSQRYVNTGDKEVGIHVVSVSIVLLSAHAPPNCQRVDLRRVASIDACLLCR
jgi:hypothetical protein